jgi:hypothetical protein
MTWPSVRYYRVRGLKHPDYIFVQVTDGSDAWITLEEGKAVVSRPVSRSDMAARFRAWRRFGAHIMRVKEF